MLEKLNRIKPWQAAIIIFFFAFLTYVFSLNNQFVGDDYGQIVGNVPVHSIRNIKIFFEGSTFYNGQGTAPLGGTYYRPLMTTAFSAVYTIFGPRQIYFHALQLILYSATAFLAYLFFKYSFSNVVALLLSLAFLLHPINSQNVYAIASLQDVLFLFFGMLSVWLLLRFKSVKSLLLVALCLLLCLLSKEAAMLFVAITLIYLYWWDRSRLFKFVEIMALPLVLYISLRLHAVGLNHNPHNAPIDSLGLAGRIFTAPSILLFYLVKLVFPLKLASAYYWVYPTFSFKHVLLPFLVDVAATALVIYGAIVIRKHSTKEQFYTYILFAAWTLIGLAAHLQLSALDATAYESWFYFPFVGLLGMIGVAWTSYLSSIRIDRHVLMACIAVALLLLGIRSGIRGTDWKNQYKLAYKDVAASSEDYNADNLIALDQLHQGNAAQALVFAKRSISIFPDYTNYNTLGEIYQSTGEYRLAEQAYAKSIDYQTAYQTVVNLATVLSVYDDPSAGVLYSQKALEVFPQGGRLWFCLAVSYKRLHKTQLAQQAAQQAKVHGYFNQAVFDQAASAN